MTTVKTKVFVVGGMVKDYGKDTKSLEFVGHDSASGGYPYAATIYSAAKTPDFERAARWLSVDAKESHLEDPKIYELVLEEVQFKEVETVRIEKQLKEVETVLVEKHYERV